MFSWSKKSDSKKKPRRRGGSGGPALNEFGIPINQESGNDEELEAELRALTGGVITLEEDLELNEEGSDVEAEFERMFSQSKSKKTKNKAGKGSATSYGEDVNVAVDLDVTNVDDGDVEDEDLEVDENDPELLGELMGLTEAGEGEEEEEEEEENESEEQEPKKQEITITSLLKERLNMYKAAEAKAKENNESSRARRFSRGIKTLQQLIKKAEAGQPVLPSDIPPVIATNLKPAPPPAPAPVPQAADEEQDEVPNIELPQKITEPGNDVPVEEISNISIDDNAREGEEECYEKNDGPAVPQQEEPDKSAEPSPPTVENPWLPTLRSRREEYKASALTAKRNNDLDLALKHVKCVKVLNVLIVAAEAGEEIDDSEIPPSLSEPPARKPVEIVKPLKFEAPEEYDNYDNYEIPKTVSEALNQRLRIYQSFEREAKERGDEAGIKRNGKIVEVYKEAIKLHKAGRKVPLAKLPTPPGCPPIPIPFELD